MTQCWIAANLWKKSKPKASPLGKLRAWRIAMELKSKPFEPMKVPFMIFVTMSFRVLLQRIVMSSHHTTEVYLARFCNTVLSITHLSHYWIYFPFYI